MTLQQEIYESILKVGHWTDDSGLIRVTGYVSESAGKFDDATNTWIPELESADIDVLEPDILDKDKFKGRKGINKLRRLFNEVRFALPGDVKYRLHADDALKGALYEAWGKDDPLQEVADTAEKPHRKANQPDYKGPKRVKYNVLDVEQPRSLVQIANYQDTPRVVFLKPEADSINDILDAFKINKSYETITGTGGRKASWGLKPYFFGSDGEFYEVEKGGARYANQKKFIHDGVDLNPEGYRLKKLATHRKASFNYAMRKREATPTLEYVTDWVRKTFTGIPEDEARAFGEVYYAMNQGEIDAQTARRVTSNIKLHGDHSIALSKGGKNWWNAVVNVPEDLNLRKNAANTPDWYNKAQGISTNIDEVLEGGLRSPIHKYSIQAHAYNQFDQGKTFRNALGVTQDRHFLYKDQPGGLMDQALKNEELLLASRTPDGALRYPDLKTASEASGGLKNALRKAGTVLPFVGAGLDAWDVQQRWEEVMNNPNEGFTDWLDKAQLGIASATLGTSFWAEPANFALGVTNLGIDAARTVFEEDKRNNFVKNMRAIGRGTTYAAQQLL